MRASRFGFIALVGALAVAGGCQSCANTSGTGAAKSNLELVPKETDVIFQANLSRMRNTEIWRKLLDFRDSDAKSKKDYDDFVTKCGLDPLKQIDSVFLAFPQTVNDTKEFAAILRGTFDQTKLLACAKDQAKKDNQVLSESDYNGHKIYSSNPTGKEGQAYATFLDNKTVVLAGKDWIKKVIDLAGGKTKLPSAKDHAELVALMKRAHTNDGLWGAGLVPQSTRDQLKADPQLSAAGSMKDVIGSIDFANGFAADIDVDLGSPADATELQAKATAQLADAKKSPQLMMTGLSSFLDSVKVDAKGATFHVSIHFNQQQVDDLTNRVKGLLNSLRGLGATMGGGGMGAPPSEPPTQMPSPPPAH